MYIKRPYYLYDLSEFTSHVFLGGGFDANYFLVDHETLFIVFHVGIHAYYLLELSQKITLQFRPTLSIHAM